jgi:putative ABC transport system permease protein
VSLLATLKVALRSIGAHRLRSFLTTLGIIFGVAAVISMMSINEAAKRETLEQIEALGTNNIRLRSVPPPAKERKQDERDTWMIRYGVTEQDGGHIAAICPQVSSLVPLRDIRKKVYAGDRRLDVKVLGTRPELAEVSDLRLGEGRFLAGRDLEASNRVCVVGAEAARRLFGRRGALGETVNVGHRYFEVVGVLEDRAVAGTGASVAGDVNNCIFIPYSTCLERFGRTTVSMEPGKFEGLKVDYDELIAVLEDVDEVEPAAAVIRRYFERTHPKRDVEVLVPLELIRQREETRRKFTLVMISIAAISLLVGGIGIMNIMLAGVTERTKEIGTRRALGARQGDILRQFLSEAVVLSAAGGVLGIGVGVGLTFLVSGTFGWKFVITWVAVLVPLVVSTAVGLLSGTYPALKAARLDPIEALRAA